MLEYVYFTQPQMPHDLSAHDMSSGYALAASVDKRLAPFLVPKGLPETDAAARLYQNLNELCGLCTRVTQENALKRQFRANQTRPSARVLDKGEPVFRKIPNAAHLPKHLFPEPSTRPYKVHAQRTPQSVVLMDPSTQQLVGRGANIPLGQILAGPRRNIACELGHEEKDGVNNRELEFELESEVLDFSDMVRGPDGGSQKLGSALRTGHRAGPRVGWGPLAPGAEGQPQGHGGVPSSMPAGRRPRAGSERRVRSSFGA